MKRKLSIILTAALLLSAVMSMGSVSAAQVSKTNADFTGFSEMGVKPVNETNFGYVFVRSGEFNQFEPVSGKFGKDPSDVSLRIHNPAETNETAQTGKENPYIDISSYMPDLVQPGDTINIHANLAFNDETNQSRYIEVAYFNDKGSSSFDFGGGSHAFDISSIGSVSCLGTHMGTIPYVKNKWYDVNLVYTVGTPAEGETAAVQNKVEVYVDGVRLGEKLFSVNAAKPIITGIRQVRVGYTNTDKDKMKFSACDLYVDDFSVAVFTEGDMPYVPSNLSVTSADGFVAGKGTEILALDPSVTVKTLTDSITVPEGFTKTYMDQDYQTLADTELVGEGYVKIVDTSNGYAYFRPVAHRSYYANVNFNDGKMGAIAKDKMDGTMAHKSSFEGGLGGKASDNKAFVIRTTDFNGEKGKGDPYINYAATSALKGVVTFECSIYLDSDDAYMNVTIPYSKTEDKLSSDVWYSPLMLKEGIVYSNGNALEMTYNAGQWYKMSCVLNTITKNSKVYINGDLIAENKLSDMKTAYRLKAEVRYPEGDGKVSSGVAAFDDFKVFYGSYDNTPNYISVKAAPAEEPSQIPVLVVDDALGQIILNQTTIDSPVVPTNLVKQSLILNAGVTASYYDNEELNSSVAAQRAIADGMVLVLESESKETYKYYTFVSAFNKVGIQVSDYQYSEVLKEIYPQSGIAAGEFLSHITPYSGCTMTVTTGEGVTVDSAALIKPGMKLVVARDGQASVSYNIAIKGLLIDEDFETWDPAIVYDSSNLKPPQPWGGISISTLGDGNPLTDIAKAQAVAEEGKGQVLKITTKGNEALEDKISNRQFVMQYIPVNDQLKNVFVVEADVKVGENHAGESQVIGKYTTLKADGTPNAENYIHVGDFKNDTFSYDGSTYTPIKGGEWHRVTAVVDVPNGRIVHFLDGRNLGTTNHDFSTFQTFTSIRLQHRFVRNVEKSDYYDNFRIYELDNMAEFSEAAISTDLTSDTLCVTSKDMTPVIKGAIGKTAGEVKAALSSANNAVVTILKNGVAEAAENDILTAEDTVRVVSAEGLCTAVYKLSSEIEIMPVELKIDGAAAEEVKAGELTASVNVLNFDGNATNVTVAVAVYHNGVLESIDFNTVSAAVNTTVTAKVQISDPADRTVKAFVLNGLTALTPLAKASLIRYIAPPVEQ